MLSFREQAAIALACRSNDENGSPFGDAAGDAQRLANQCCETWGHDKAYDHESGTHCARCGVPVAS